MSENGAVRTAAALVDKEIHYVRAASFGASQTQPSSADFVSALGLTSNSSLQSLKVRLGRVLSEVYALEEEFDVALFGALKQTFPESLRTDVSSNAFIPYKPEDTQSYAYGFAR